MNVKPKILIIDDEPDMLRGCARILSALGNNPYPVPDGKQAINLLQDEEFDLVFATCSCRISTPPVPWT